jgi:hypothetical protein
VLAQSEIVPYLLDRGLVDPCCIVDGELAVTDVSRRNRNFSVETGEGGYLVKQSATIAREAAAYRLLEGRPLLPRCVLHDPEQQLLVLELIPRARDLLEYHSAERRFPPSFAARLGAALSSLHRTELRDTDLRGGVPWILSIDRPGLELLRDGSAANVQLVRLLQATPAFGALLADLRADWRPAALIHHDAKWENCLVHAAPGASRTTRLTLIDWEFADRGDPCWDVATAIGSYLSFWVLSIPISGEEPPDRFLELALHPLERMQPAIHAFWRAYADGMGLNSREESAWLLRTVRFTAARLLQTAWEHLQAAAHMPGTIVCLLQLSANIAQHPGEAIRQLLGLRAPA